MSYKIRQQVFKRLWQFQAHEIGEMAEVSYESFIGLLITDVYPNEPVVASASFAEFCRYWHAQDGPQFSDVAWSAANLLSALKVIQKWNKDGGNALKKVRRIHKALEKRFRNEIVAYERLEVARKAHQEAAEHLDLPVDSISPPYLRGYSLLRPAFRLGVAPWEARLSNIMDVVRFYRMAADPDGSANRRTSDESWTIRFLWWHMYIPPDHLMDRSCFKAPWKTITDLLDEVGVAVDSTHVRNTIIPPYRRKQRRR